MNGRPVLPICQGCAWNKKFTCEVIKEPAYFLQKGKHCFARATAEQVKQIEQEIAAYKQAAS